MSTSNIITLARKRIAMTVMLGATLLIGGPANAQVVTTVAPVVNPVVTPVVNTITAPVVAPVVVAPVVAAVTSDVNPVVDVDPVVDVNPDVNVDVDVNIVGPDMTEGKWFATIKREKIRIEFRTDSDYEHNWNSSTDFQTE